MAVRMAVCDSARSRVRQCAWQCLAVCAVVRVRLSGSARGSVRLSSGAAASGSSATLRSVLYRIRAVNARLPPPAPHRSHQYMMYIRIIHMCRGLPSPATRCSVLYHIQAVDTRLPPPTPRCSQYFVHMLWPALRPATLCFVLYQIRAVEARLPPCAPRRS
jgi:hypothetical protein